MLFQLLAVVVLLLVIWVVVRMFSGLFRVAGVVFGSFVFLYWLVFSPRNVWALLFELAGLSVLLFLLAGVMGGLRRSRW
jgi:hypothetical protein